MTFRGEWAGVFGRSTGSFVPGGTAGVQVSEFRAWDFWFKVSGFRVSGLGFLVRLRGSENQNP